MLSQVTTVNCDRISTASTDSFNTDDEAPIFDNPAMASSSIYTLTVYNEYLKI